MNDEFQGKLRRVRKSTYRIKVMKALHHTFKTPTALSKETGIVLNHISNVLIDLKETGLVECINEEARKGRLYRLTGDGDRIMDILAAEDKT